MVHVGRGEVGVQLVVVRPDQTEHRLRRSQLELELETHLETGLLQGGRAAGHGSRVQLLRRDVVVG